MIVVVKSSKNDYLYITGPSGPAFNDNKLYVWKTLETILTGLSILSFGEDIFLQEKRLH